MLYVLWVITLQRLTRNICCTCNGLSPSKDSPETYVVRVMGYHPPKTHQKHILYVLWVITLQRLTINICCTCYGFSPTTCYGLSPTKDSPETHVVRVMGSHPPKTHQKHMLYVLWVITLQRLTINICCTFYGLSRSKDSPETYVVRVMGFHPPKTHQKHMLYVL